MIDLAHRYKHDNQPMVKATLTPEQETIRSNLIFAMASRGITARTLAEACGVTEQAVSGWRKTGKIARQHLPKIAAKLQTNVEFLLVPAVLTMTTEDGVSHTGVMTFSESSEPQPEYAGLAKPHRRIPVVGTAKMGNDGHYDEISAVPGGGDGFIEMNSDDEHAYCLRVRGMSMHPAIRDGWYVVVEPNSTPSEGEYVVLKFRDGRRMVKELLFRRSTSVQVMSVNMDERFSVELNELEAMHAVAAVVSPSKWRPD